MFDLRTSHNTASTPNITANRPLLTPRTAPALAPFEDPVGVLVLLVGAEVPLADDADVVAPDVDEVELDFVVEVSVLLVVVLVSVEEGVLELDGMVVMVEDEELADSTELEPSTLILSL